MATRKKKLAPLQLELDLTLKKEDQQLKEDIMFLPFLTVRQGSLLGCGGYRKYCRTCNKFPWIAGLMFSEYAMEPSATNHSLQVTNRI